MPVIIEQKVAMVQQGAVANTDIREPSLDENGKALISEDNSVIYEE